MTTVETTREELVNRITNFLFGKTNEYVRKSTAEVPEEKKVKIAKILDVINAGTFGCQTSAARKLAAALLDVPTTYFAQRIVLPEYVLVLTTHKTPRFVMSRGREGNHAGDMMVDFKVSKGERRYQLSQVTVDFVKKDAVRAWVEANYDAIVGLLPTIV